LVYAKIRGGAISRSIKPSNSRHEDSKDGGKARNDGNFRSLCWVHTGESKDNSRRIGLLSVRELTLIALATLGIDVEVAYFEGT